MKKVIGGFLGVAVIIGVVCFALVKFEVIDLSMLNRTSNENKNLNETIYFKDVNEQNVKYNEGIFYADNQLSLISKENVRKQKIDKLAKKYDAEVVGYIEFTGDYQLEFSEEKSYDELNSIISELESNKNVESASLYTVNKLSSTKAYYPENDSWGGSDLNELRPKDNNWAVEAIKAPSAWAFAKDMSGVKIGLIDTNVDSEHEDLQFKKVWNLNTSSDNVHGTEVAGIMAAKFNGNKNDTQVGITGICPNPVLYAASYKGASEYIGTMNIKCSLARLILSGVKVINCSFTDEEFTIAASINEENENLKNILFQNKKTYTHFLNKFKEYDFLIVKSSLNLKKYYCKIVEQSEEHPYGIELYDSEKLKDKKGLIKCEYINPQNDMICNITDKNLKNKILVVGSCGKFAKGKYEISEFSGEDRIDVLAPGEYIYTTEPNNSYTKAEDLGNNMGNSYSAAYVSGLAGVIYGINENLTANQIKNIIVSTATTDVDLTFIKMINARMAVELANQYKNEEKDLYDKKGIFLCSAVDKYQYKTSKKMDKEKDPIEASHLKDVEVILESQDGKEVYNLKTNESGEIAHLIEPGIYDVEIKKENYEPINLKNIEIKAKETVYKKLFMNKISKVTGTVVDEKGRTLEGVNAILKSNDENISIRMDKKGSFSKELKNSTYTLIIFKEGYLTKKMTVEIDGIQNDLGEIVLEKEIMDISSMKVVMEPLFNMMIDYDGKDLTYKECIKKEKLGKLSYFVMLSCYYNKAVNLDRNFQEKYGFDICMDRKELNMYIKAINYDFDNSIINTDEEDDSSLFKYFQKYDKYAAIETCGVEWPSVEILDIYESVDNTYKVKVYTHSSFDTDVEDGYVREYTVTLVKNSNSLSKLKYSIIDIQEN